MTEISESTKTLISAAAERRDRLAPPPAARGGARNQIRDALLKPGYAHAVNLGAPQASMGWFKDGDKNVGLKITKAGFRAVGLGTQERKPRDRPEGSASASRAPKGNPAIEAAERGELPAPPDFTAATHKPYRAKLARLIEMAEGGDVEGLQAVTINPSSSSPKAMLKYRDLAVTAILARRKAVPEGDAT